MNNRWLSLAMISFVGILVSSLGLFVVQSMTGLAGVNSAHQGHGAQDQAMVSSPNGIDYSGANHGQSIMQNTQMPIQSYPAMAYPSPYYQTGYTYNPYMTQYDPMQYQIFMMRQLIGQLRDQLNNINNINNMNNMNNSGSGMSTMPMM